MCRLEPERAEIVRYAQRLRPDHLVVGMSGNISARSGDLVAITPTGVDYDELSPEKISVLRLDGAQVDGELAPSSEVPMHLAVYQRTTATAVVHTHSPYATTLSTLVDELPPIHYMLAQLGGAVRVAPYATFGTDELARNMVEGLEGRSAVILQNHGTITTGATLAQAYDRSITLEWLSELYYRARLFGTPHLLAAEEIDTVVQALRNYGQPTRSS